MTIAINEIQRVFRYNGVALPDVPGMTPREVRDLYSAQYPELISAEIEAGEQSRRIGNLAIVLPEFGKVGVVVRFREGADTLDGRVKRLPVDQVEDCGADCIVGRFGIENDDRRVA